MMNYICLSLYFLIWTFYCFRLKHVTNICWDFRISNHCRVFWHSILPSNHSATVTTINYDRSEILVSCLVYIDQLLFYTNCWYFFNKAYYQESYILIIEYSSVVIVAEWYEPTASNNKSDGPQVNFWNNWKTLKYLNINDSIHLKDLEISKYKRESKARMPITFWKR
jgi:hypothetical protein